MMKARRPRIRPRSSFTPIAVKPEEALRTKPPNRPSRAREARNGRSARDRAREKLGGRLVIAAEAELDGAVLEDLGRGHIGLCPEGLGGLVNACLVGEHTD